MKKCCVVGLGYIGLPTAVMLATCGAKVLGIDTNGTYLADLLLGRASIEEPNLNNLLERVLKNGNLQLASTPESANVFVIAVPTPLNEEETCDLHYVIEAIRSVIPFLSSENLVIIESTVPPSTCTHIIKPLLEEAGFVMGRDIFLAHCPERVLPGRILEELVYNNRVIGGYSDQCSKKAADVYGMFVKGEILITDLNTAEMTKLVENTFRDLNIAFVNELIQLCNHLCIDGLEVIRMANKHPRVNLHKPGPGVGGHCLAVDPYFIVEKAPKMAPLISMARKINSSMPKYIVSTVLKILEGTEKPQAAVLGVSYKGDVGDTRESPAMEIIELLSLNGVAVSAFDPYVETISRPLYECVLNSDILIILTDHREFFELDYEQLVTLMRTPIIFDTRQILDKGRTGSEAYELYNLGNIFKLYQKYDVAFR